MSLLMKFDNDQSESNLCKALGAVLNTQVKLITNCSIRTKSENQKKLSEIKVVIIVVGSEKIYLFNLDFSSIQFEFCYSDIISVVEEQSNEHGLLINLKDVKFNESASIPYIYISINNRKSFISIVKCYYSTFYAFNYGDLKELKLKKKDFIEFKNHKVKLETKKQLFHHPPKNYLAYEVCNYRFFVPSKYKQLNNLDHNSNNHHKQQQQLENEDVIEEESSEDDCDGEGDGGVFGFNKENREFKLNNNENLIDNNNLMTNHSIEINKAENNNNNDHNQVRFNSKVNEIKEEDKDKEVNGKEEGEDENEKLTGFTFQGKSPVLKDTFECEIFFEFEDNIPVSKIFELNNPLNRLDITANNKTQEIIQKILGVSKFIVLKSFYYIKKYNITNDPAKWDCWRVEVCIFEPFYAKVILIMLRRKFIPPFFEFCSDICFWIIQKYSHSIHHENFIYLIHNDNYEIDKDFELIIDSLHPAKPQDYINLKNVLLSKIDSLALDPDTLWFFRTKLGIFGEEVFLFSLQFVYLCCIKITESDLYGKIENENIIKKEFALFQDKNLNTIINTPLLTLKLYYLMNSSPDLKRKFQFISQLIPLLESRYYNYCDSNIEKFAEAKTDFEFVSGQNFQDIFKKFDKLFNEFYISLIKNSKADIDADKKEIISYSWEERVAKYLIYCLDGGLTNGFIDLELLFECVSFGGNKMGVFYEIIFKFLCPKVPFVNLKQIINDKSKFMKQDHYLQVLCKIIKYFGLHDFLSIDNDVINGELLNIILDKYLCYEVLDSLRYYISNHINIQYKYPLQQITNEISNLKNKANGKGNLDVLNNTTNNNTSNNNNINNNSDLGINIEYIEKELRKKVEAYLKKFHDIKKGLLKIYQSTVINPLLHLLTVQILIDLCTFDSSLVVVAYLLNCDIINVITKKLNTQYYNLYHANLKLLYLLSSNIKQTNSTRMIYNKDLYIEICNAIVYYQYRDVNKIVLEDLLKCLCNLIASDQKSIQFFIFDLCSDNNFIIALNDESKTPLLVVNQSNNINNINNNNKKESKIGQQDEQNKNLNKTISNTKENINANKNNPDNNSITPNNKSNPNNITNNNLIIQGSNNPLHKENTLEEKRKDSNIPYYLLRILSHSYPGLDESEEFFKQLEIDTLISRFFALFIKQNNQHKQYLIKNLHFFYAMYSKLENIVSVYVEFQKLFIKQQNGKLPFNDLNILNNFKVLIRFLSRFLYFVYVLFDNNQIAFDYISNCPVFKGLENLFIILYNNRGSEEIKNLTKIDDKLYDEYLSSLFSMERLIYPPEDDVDAQLEKMMKKK